MGTIGDYLLEQLTSLGHLSPGDIFIVLATTVIIWGVTEYKRTNKRLLILEKHKIKTETIITALPFMSVGTGVWYTDDTRNGKYKPSFQCFYIKSLEKKEEDVSCGIKGRTEEKTG